MKHTDCNAAKPLEMEGKVGTLNKGVSADMLIVDKNPFEDIKALGKLEQHCFAIIKEGRLMMSGTNCLKKNEIYT